MTPPIHESLAPNHTQPRTSLAHAPHLSIILTQSRQRFANPSTIPPTAFDHAEPRGQTSNKKLGNGLQRSSAPSKRGDGTYGKALEHSEPPAHPSPPTFSVAKSLNAPVVLALWGRITRVRLLCFCVCGSCSVPGPSLDVGQCSIHRGCALAVGATVDAAFAASPAR